MRALRSLSNLQLGTAACAERCLHLLPLRLAKTGARCAAAGEDSDGASSTGSTGAAASWGQPEGQRQQRQQQGEQRGSGSGAASGRSGGALGASPAAAARQESGGGDATWGVPQALQQQGSWPGDALPQRQAASEDSEASRLPGDTWARGAPVPEDSADSVTGPLAGAGGGGGGGGGDWGTQAAAPLQPLQPVQQAPPVQQQQTVFLQGFPLPPMAGGAAAGAAPPMPQVPLPRPAFLPPHLANSPLFRNMAAPLPAAAAAAAAAAAVGLGPAAAPELAQPYAQPPFPHHMPPAAGLGGLPFPYPPGALPQQGFGGYGQPGFPPHMGQMPFVPGGGAAGLGAGMQQQPQQPGLQPYMFGGGAAAQQPGQAPVPSPQQLGSMWHSSVNMAGSGGVQ
jgi:hypothetical protein